MDRGIVAYLIALEEAKNLDSSKQPSVLNLFSDKFKWHNIILKLGFFINELATATIPNSKTNNIVVIRYIVSIREESIQWIRWKRYRF